MTNSVLARFTCAVFALTITSLSVTQVTSVNPINFEGEGNERPALYA